MKKHRILWIEDSAFHDLAHLSGPVYMSRKFSLEIAIDASEAISHLSSPKGAFDVVIVDIRIPPGNDPQWIKFTGGKDKNKARLGLELLKMILAPQTSSLSSQYSIAKWVTSEKIGVFTVESSDEIKTELNMLDKIVYKQKKAAMSSGAFLKLVEDVILKQGKFLYK